MHIVEVRRRNADLAAAMAQMRTWLDNQAIEPSLFEIAFLPGRESRFRLQFKELSDAVTFASSFEGEVLDTGLDLAAARSSAAPLKIYAIPQYPEALHRFPIGGTPLLW
jgi:hypothetical protein